MQHHRPALSWHRRRTNRRGAVFLLAVYFASLMLLILSGLAIQRTMLETRAGQISRDTSQSFYLAEGAFDSALARLKTETLANQTPSPVPALPGQATYAVETVSADLSVGQQTLVRRIIATGQNGSSGTQQVSGYFVEEGPLAGVYGKKVTVAHSSLETEDASTIQTFLLASMPSQRGSIASSRSGVTLNLDGVAHGDPTQSPRNNELALADSVSGELRSLKSGYMYVKRLSAVDPTSMKFAEEFLQDQIPHATGAVSSGVKITAPPAKLKTPFALLAKYGWCSSDVVVPRTGLVINDVSELPEDPGTTLIDIDSNPGNIITCVNSIHPEGDEAWLDTILHDPPEVRFTKPATIYVTGSKMFDVEDYHLPPPFNMFTAGQLFPSAGLLNGLGAAGAIQTTWRVSVGAKISAVDAFGKTIPNGVNIIMTEPLVRASWSPPAVQSTPPGLIWVKPGKFSGSIYAPDSLVLLRERALGDRDLDSDATAKAVARYAELSAKDDSLTQQERKELAYFELNGTNVYEPLELQSVVGNEVILEIGTDRIQIGHLVDDSEEEKTVTLQGWTTGP